MANLLYFFFAEISFCRLLLIFSCLWYDGQYEQLEILGYYHEDNRHEALSIKVYKQ